VTGNHPDSVSLYICNPRYEGVKGTCTGTMYGAEPPCPRVKDSRDDSNSDFYISFLLSTLDSSTTLDGTIVFYSILRSEASASTAGGSPRRVDSLPFGFETCRSSKLLSRRASR